MIGWRPPTQVVCSTSARAPDQSWRTGERVPAEELITLLPAGTAEGYPRADLGEVQLRKAAGESPVAVEYQQRFLHLIEHLDRQFELEQVLGELPDDTLIGDRPEPPDSGTPNSPAGYEVVGKLGEERWGWCTRPPARKCSIAMSHSR